MMLTVNMEYDIIIGYVSSDGFCCTCCNRSGWVSKDVPVGTDTLY